MSNCKAEATKLLSEFFGEELAKSKLTIRDFEEYVSKEGTKVLRDAMVIALERLDDELFADHERELKVKEKRSRSLASTVGDLKFKRRIYVDQYGNSGSLLDDRLDIGYRSRISPLAFEFLVNMATHVSYQVSSNILTQRGGSTISANTVMRAIRRVGLDCKCEDAKLAYDLYVNGVLPDSNSEVDELFLEGDGTYIALQNGKKAEVQALVAYAGKEGEKRVKRVDACHFGCVGSKDEFWTQGISAVATNFDISQIKKVHMGFDGEAKYQQAEKYFLINAEFDGNLDPFHLNRDVARCFRDDDEAKAQVMSCLWYKNPLDAADMVMSYAEEGVCKKDRAEKLAKYIRNNAEFIKKNDFTLGTMEAEQEHLYKSRMAAFPCAWSVEGADAIARVRSRRQSGRKLIFRSRQDTIPEEVKKARKKRIYEFLEKTPLVFQVTCGKGYNYPHQAHLNQRIKSGLCSAWSYCQKNSGVRDPY